MDESIKKLRLSQEGHDLLEQICKECKHAKSDAQFWCAHATMFTGEAKRFIEQRLNPPNWKDWTKFGEGLSESTWLRFIDKKHKPSIERPAFETFCGTVNQQSQNIEFTPERVGLISPHAIVDSLKKEIEKIEDRIRLRFQISPEQWGNLLQSTTAKEIVLKDYEYIESDPLKVTVDDIYCEKSHNDGGVYILPIYATVSDGQTELKIKWCTAFVSNYGWCELLLDIRPYVWHGNQVKYKRHKYRRLTIEQPFTEIALDKLEEQYQKAFAGNKRITNFGGSLTYINRRQFRRFFRRYRALYPDKTEQEIAVLALKKTPFGRARVARGITEFSVTILSRSPDGTPDRVQVMRACRPQDW